MKKLALASIGIVGAALLAPLALLVPLFGSMTLETGGGGGGGGGEGGGGGGDEGGGAGSGSGAGSGEGGSGGGSGSGSGSGEGGGEWTPPSREEWDNINRRARENAEAVKKLTDAEAERKRKADEDAGNFKEIAEREKAEREKAQRELDEERTRARVERIAGRLKFRDPEDVLHRLSDEQRADDSNVEKALKALAKEKPYLVTDGETPRQRDLGGGDGGGDDTPVGAGPSRLARAYGSGGKS